MTQLPQHRQASTSVQLTDDQGVPLANSDVEVEFLRHSFGFGNIAFDLVGIVAGDPPAGAASIESFGGNVEPNDPHDFAEKFLRLFSMATLPFYWGRYEPAPGVKDEARLLKTARWLQERGVAVKGHPLVWHTVQPDWLLELPQARVEELLRERVRELVGTFAGVVDHWDAINEVVIMPRFTNGDNAITPLAAAKGRVEMVRLAFEEARAANPNAKLVLNDFDLSPEYEQLIEEVLEAGIQLDAIGLQTHMHQGYRGEEWTQSVVDRFARFGLPLQMTETTLVSGHLMPEHIVDLNDYQIPEWPTTPEGEARQADEIERHYRLLFGHPAIESITYWGLTDVGSWLGAPCGLLRPDGSPKPAYETLDRLINQEWGYPSRTLRTDDEGRVQIEGPLGDYRVTADSSSREVSLTRSK